MGAVVGIVIGNGSGCGRILKGNHTESGFITGYEQKWPSDLMVVGHGFPIGMPSTYGIVDVFHLTIEGRLQIKDAQRLILKFAFGHGVSAVWTRRKGVSPRHAGDVEDRGAHGWVGQIGDIKHVVS